MNIEHREITDLINNCSHNKISELFRIQESNKKIKLPIGVIGTGDPSLTEYQTAYDIGRLLARAGFSIICGGRGGIMEAACKGVSIENGISIGLLPELHTQNANKYVSIPITTGLGLARNTIISASAHLLISIGGSNGTLSEISYGLQFNKKVFSIYSKFDLPGITKFHDYDELIQLIYSFIKV